MNVKELKEFLKDIDDDVEVCYFLQRWCDNTGYYTNILTMDIDNMFLSNNRLLIGSK